MNTTYNALIVPARLTHSVRLERVDADVAELQKLVAGNVGSITGADWHVYFNDEGYRLPQNDRADVLIREAGVDREDTLNGVAVFLGHGPLKDEADAPARLVRLAERLFDLPLAA